MTRQILLIIIMALLLSCGGKAKRSHDLMHDIDAYNEGIRWRKLPQAAVRIPPKERDAFLDEREQLEEDLRIDDFEMTRLKINGDTQESADVQIRWTWHMDAEGIVKETTSKQEWKRFGNRWLMVKEIHVRGDEMPGVADADEDADDLKLEGEDDLKPEDKEGMGGGEGEKVPAENPMSTTKKSVNQGIAHALRRADVSDSNLVKK